MRPFGIALTIYLIVMTALFSVIGYWPLTAVGSLLFMSVSFLLLFAVVQSIMHAKDAVAFLKKGFSLKLHAGWIALITAGAFYFLKHPPELPHFPEQGSNSIILLIGGFILIPLYFAINKNRFNS